MEIKNVSGFGKLIGIVIIGNGNVVVVDRGYYCV